MHFALVISGKACNILHNTRELKHREHIAGKEVHPGKGREIVDSHFVGVGEKREA